MSQPLVSVIIPCYRQAHYLTQAVESVLQQSYPTIETIVVNDGSDDDVEGAILSYRHRVCYIYRENGGLPAARNTGIQAAQGRYLLFLDADDLLHPSAIEWLIDAMENQEDRLCHMGCRRFVDRTSPHSGAVYPPSQKTALSDLIHSSLAPVHCVLCPATAVRAVGCFEESLQACEDWDLWIRLAFYGLHSKAVPLVGAYYRQMSDSMSKNQMRMLTARTRVLLRAYDHLIQKPALLESLSGDLLEALHRVRRYGIVQRLASSLMSELCIAIRRLDGMGFLKKRSAPKKLLDLLTGERAEKIVLWLLRFFYPPAYRFYENGVL